MPRPLVPHKGSNGLPRWAPFQSALPEEAPLWGGPPLRPAAARHLPTHPGMTARVVQKVPAVHKDRNRGRDKTKLLRGCERGRLRGAFSAGEGQREREEGAPNRAVRESGAVHRQGMIVATGQEPIGWAALRVWGDAHLTAWRLHRPSGFCTTWHPPSAKPCSSTLCHLNLCRYDAIALPVLPPDASIQEWILLLSCSVLVFFSGLFPL